MAYAKSQMTGGDIICKWPGTSLESRLIRKTIAKGADGISDLQQVLWHSPNPWIASEAALAIAITGQGIQDTHKIIERLADVQTRGYHDYCEENLGKALVIISGIDLPATTPASLWRGILNNGT